MALHRMVIALGGNALQKKGEASAASQINVARETARQLVTLISKGHQVVIVHGNGPQVGDILLHEEAFNTAEAPTLPLDSCDAMSQGSIGYWLQQGIGNELRAQHSQQSVASIVTQVIVDASDPAFQNPTKPIGPFYESEAEARTAAEARHFTVTEDAGRGWRRVVPSPLPKTIVEKPLITSLIDDGFIVIAAGGGGVPVLETEQGLQGIAAVIDKDMSASVLADGIEAEVLLILTSVEAAKIRFNTPNEQTLHHVSCEQMRRYCSDGEFASGSMLPKVLASLAFVEKRRGHRKAIIASLDTIQAAMDGKSGTIIT